MSVAALPPLLLLFLALPVAAINMETEAECAKGSHREMTDDPYQPLKCVKDGPKGARLSEVAGPQGFKFRPRCPHGTRPAENPGGLQPYRCVPVESDSPAPELSPMKGGGLDPLDDGKRRLPPPPARKAAPAGVGPKAYRRYTVPGELAFEYPDGFQAADAWKDETPMLSFTLDDGSPGKPVTLVVTKAKPGSTGFVDMEDAIAKDKDWQGAKELPAATLAGRKAKFTLVPGESKTAYLPLGAGGYYQLAYSAPADKFDAFLPAFDRLLSTLRLTARGR